MRTQDQKNPEKCVTAHFSGFKKGVFILNLRSPITKLIKFLFFSVKLTLFRLNRKKRAFSSGDKGQTAGGVKRLQGDAGETAGGEQCQGGVKSPE